MAPLQLARSDVRSTVQAKPDLVAPGVGIESLRDPGEHCSTRRKAAYLRDGTSLTALQAVSELSGTSMAAPVVTGTVALMLQANPTLTPNAVKAILQYTAAGLRGYDALTQGAGFLNALGAVRLARFFRTGAAGRALSGHAGVERQIIWGNHLLTGGVLDPARPPGPSTSSGAPPRPYEGDNIVWGTRAAATTATTSSGAPTSSGATTSSGAPPTTATTSSGAPPATATTSSGAPSGRRQHRVGHPR